MTLTDKLSTRPQKPPGKPRLVKELEGADITQRIDKYLNHHIDQSIIQHCLSKVLHKHLQYVQQRLANDKYFETVNFLIATYCNESNELGREKEKPFRVPGLSDNPELLWKGDAFLREAMNGRIEMTIEHVEQIQEDRKGHK